MTDEEERDEAPDDGPAPDELDAGSDAPDEGEGEGESTPDGGDDGDDEELRRLLRGALARQEPSPSSDVLAGVQKRLRERSRGKFYADGWSTERHPPTMTYLWTSLIMLAIALVLWAALGSLSGEALEVNNEPAPVRIIHPRSVPSR